MDQKYRFTWSGLCTIFWHTNCDKNFFIFKLFLTSGNKKEKASEFVQSEMILKDVLFGVGKFNITNDTR